MDIDGLEKLLEQFEGNVNRRFTELGEKVDGVSKGLPCQQYQERIAKLEKWRYYVAGGLGVIVAIVTFFWRVK